MRILKFLAAAFVAVLTAGSLQAQRPDNDLQAKAREALQQAEADQDAQAASPNKTAAPVKKKATPPAAPVAATPAPAATQGGLNADTEAKAREQLRRAEADNANANPPQAQPDAEAARAEHLRQLEAARARQAVAVTPPATTPAPFVQTTPAPAVPRLSGGLSPEAEAKARESMRQAMEELDAQQNKATVAAGTQRKYTPPPAGWDQTPTAVKPAPRTTFEPGVTSAATGATTPTVAPTANSKEARLANLLNQYKMDQITPQEYFQQKAKILSEP